MAGFQTFDRGRITPFGDRYWPEAGDRHGALGDLVARLLFGQLVSRFRRMYRVNTLESRTNSLVPLLIDFATVVVLRQFCDGRWAGGLKRENPLENSSRGVAQPGSAPALGAGGRWFESSRPDQKSLEIHQFHLVLRA